jgi:hypothetical protein
MQPLELSDMLVELRRELQIAQEKAKDKNLKFKLENLEIELAFTVSKDANAGGKVKFLAVEAEIGGQYTTQIVHKIKLKMHPETGNGGDTLISSTKTKRPD